MISRLSSLGPAALAALLASVSASCATDPAGEEEPPELGMRVRWLTGEPSADLPADLDSINIKVFRDPTSDVFEDTSISRSRFMTSETGRTFLSHPLLDDLPVGSPVRIVIEGLNADRTLRWIGQIGPIVLEHGERRFVDLKMYELGRSIVLSPDDVPGRFMHTATALPDGRVLVAGGFDSIESMAECPDGAPAEARCFLLGASRDAFVFDPTTGKFHRLRDTMLQPRGGHSATLLPGGRVLLAGGAAAGMLVLSPLGDPDAPRGYAPTMLPLRADAEIGAHATFEVFVPNANREAEDADRDGDPGRGGFTGSAGAATAPGRLGYERFLHAAAVVPGQPSRVLLAGGFGADGQSGADSWEIYDDDKAGGYGVYDASANSLTASRPLPSAVALSVPDPEGRVWIFGGNVALDNDDLADIWRPVEGDPNGMVQPATETPFPNAVDGDETERPEYALLKPSVASIMDGTTALVTGWFGPRCMPGDTTPVFPTMPDGSDTEPCGHTGPSRSFVVDGLSGVTRPQEIAGPHAFGAMTMLDDGTVVLSGGIASIVWNRQAVIETFTGALAGGTAERGPSFMLQMPRVFHASAGLPQSGVIGFGGITVSTDARNASLVSTAEVLYPPRPVLERPTTGGSPDAGTM